MDRARAELAEAQGLSKIYSSLASVQNDVHDVAREAGSGYAAATSPRSVSCPGKMRTSAKCSRARSLSSSLAQTVIARSSLTGPRRNRPSAPVRAGAAFGSWSPAQTSGTGDGPALQIDHPADDGSHPLRRLVPRPCAGECHHKCHGHRPCPRHRSIHRQPPPRFGAAGRYYTCPEDQRQRYQDGPSHSTLSTPGHRDPWERGATDNRAIHRSDQDSPRALDPLSAT